MQREWTTGTLCRFNKCDAFRQLSVVREVNSEK